MTRVTRALKRNGTIAVFFVRKVPAPFTLVNIVMGASTIRYGDFIVGTVLGMGAFAVYLVRVRVYDEVVTAAPAVTPLPSNYLNKRRVVEVLVDVALRLAQQ